MWPVTHKHHNCSGWWKWSKPFPVSLASHVSHINSTAFTADITAKFSAQRPPLQRSAQTTAAALCTETTTRALHTETTITVLCTDHSSSTTHRDHNYSAPHRPQLQCSAQTTAAALCTETTTAVFISWLRLENWDTKGGVHQHILCKLSAGWPLRHFQFVRPSQPLCWLTFQTLPSGWPPSLLVTSLVVGFTALLTTIRSHYTQDVISSFFHITFIFVNQSQSVLFGASTNHLAPPRQNVHFSFHLAKLLKHFSQSSVQNSLIKAPPQPFS